MSGQKCEIAELRQWKRKTASGLPFSVATDESLAGPAAANDRKFQPAFRTGRVEGNISHPLCHNSLGELRTNPLFVFRQGKHDGSKMLQCFHQYDSSRRCSILDVLHHVLDVRGEGWIDDHGAVR